jgi:5'-nucleotidase (lipoprotein e(P4) family)
MDLDETVFANSAFRATLVRNGLDYDNRIWDAWQEFGVDRVALIPGAKNFIVEANNSGVAVVFVSNRDEKFREQTKKVFARFGIPLTEEALLRLKRFETDSDDKTSRFEEAERDYSVLLYVGDSLRDFDETFQFKIANNATEDDLDRIIRIRKEAVDRNSAVFGDKWIILPNPVYGEWISPLGRGYDDFNRLAPAVPEILPVHLRVISRAGKVITTPTVIILCIASFIGGGTLVLLLLKLKARPSKG